MRWRGRERSSNVEDRRGMSPKMAMGGGGGILAIIVVLIVKFMGGGAGMQQLAGNAARNLQDRAAQAPAGQGIDDDNREFVEVVLRDTETIWTKLFDEQIEGASYQEPRLELFTGQTQTACGPGQAAMGPFYCPADKKIYIDPTFFDDLARRHQAPGDFAQAYVIAHEVAHHVQNLLRYNRAVNEARGTGNKIKINQESVRLELQADFLAGVWAHHAHREYGILEDGDMEEAINAANQIGDDALMEAAGRRVDVHSFTHGSSAQRVYWFKRGLLSGDLRKAEEMMYETPFDKL